MSKGICQSPKWWTSQHGIVHRNMQTEEWWRSFFFLLSHICTSPMFSLHQEQGTPAHHPCVPCTRSRAQHQAIPVSSSYDRRLPENSCPTVVCFPGHPMYLFPPSCPTPEEVWHWLYSQNLKTFVFSRAFLMLRETSVFLVKPPTLWHRLVWPTPYKGVVAATCFVLSDQICIYESQNVSTQGFQ